MDVIRRNTDYALRLVAGLVGNYGGAPVSASRLAEKCGVSETLACKLLQKLASSRLVISRMGANGGFELAKRPEKISLYQVIAAIQNNICLNRCVPDANPPKGEPQASRLRLWRDFAGRRASSRGTPPEAKSCPKRSVCKTRKKLIALQKYIEDYLKNITLDELK